MDDSENLIRGFVYHGAVIPPFDDEADTLARRERELAHVAHLITATYRQLARDRYLRLKGVMAAGCLAFAWWLIRH